jgi:hypothetical protein
MIRGGLIGSSEGSSIIMTTRLKFMRKIIFPPIRLAFSCAGGLVVFVAALFLVESTFADEKLEYYELTNNYNKDMCLENSSFCSNVDLCEKLLVNFNSEQYSDRQPMVCERSFDPKLGFASPKWQPILDGDIPWKAIKNAYLLRTGESNQENFEAIWEVERQRLQTLSKYETIFWISAFDFDNSGDEERIVRLVDYPCSNQNEANYIYPAVPTIFVLNENNDLDVNYIDRIYIHADLFQFGSRTYAALWRGHADYNEGEITIHKISRVRNRVHLTNAPLCRFEYLQ